MTASEGRARDLDRYSRLARSKFDELLTEATTASGDQTGDFEAEGARDVTWTFTLEATGVENLDAAKLVVSARNGGGTAPQATLSKLVYRAPLTTGAIQ